MRKSRGSGLRRGWVVGLTGIALAVQAGGAASASAIHRGREHEARVNVARVNDARAQAAADWSGYLHGGPAMWTRVTHPPVTQALIASIWHSIRADRAVGRPMIAFLMWKQSLDPARFAHYHPKLSPALHRIAKARWTPPAIIPTPTTTGGTGTSGGSSPPTTEPQNLVPTSTPEPGTMLIALGMSVWAVVWTRRRGR